MEQFKGVTFGYYARNGYFSSSEAERQVEAIASLGIPWVCLVTTVMQETFCSTRIFRDFHQTPGDDELVHIIGLLHRRGIRVMLRPMIECWDGTQRGNIHLPQGQIFPDRPFHYRTDWFRSYTDLTRHYTRIAERTGCEAYGLDSELNQLASASQDWLPVVDAARAAFHGHLTTSLIDTPQFIRLLDDPNCWFYALDSVGSSMYAPASKTGGDDIPSMMRFIEPIVSRNRDFALKYGKLFYFGECGCCATENATRLPYYWKNGRHYDGNEQANYMETVIRAFSAEPWWGGMFWWKWEEQNYRAEFHDDPAGDKGFTIDGKPAATIMKRWCDGSLLRPNP